jgi:hypothetical protein
MNGRMRNIGSSWCSLGRSRLGASIKGRPRAVLNALETSMALSRILRMMHGGRVSIRAPSGPARKGGGGKAGPSSALTFGTPLPKRRPCANSGLFVTTRRRKGTASTRATKESAMRSRCKDTKSPNVVPSASRNDGLTNFIFVYTLVVQKIGITRRRRKCCESKICVEVKGLFWLRTTYGVCLVSVSEPQPLNDRTRCLILTRLLSEISS